MKKVISNILIILAIVLILKPSTNSRKEVLEARETVKDIDSNKLSGSIIEIDKIDLRLPIKNGATHENMTSSVATMTHNQIQGGTNFTLAGHRNLRRGKNFNRLDELDIGDVVRIKENNKKYEFEIYNIDVVEPTDTYVLDSTGTTEITLVTCYPKGISTHRLVIKGLLRDEECLK